MAIAINARVGSLIRPVVVLLAWAGFVSFKLSEAVSGSPIAWQDTDLYEKVSHAGWFSGGLWTGERAPLIPVFLKLTGPMSGFVWTQTLFSTVCWTALAFAVMRVVPAGWWQVAATVVVLAVATTEPVRLWDHSVLSETMALSWLALLSGALLLVAQRPTWWRIGLAAVAALGFAATRDTDIFTPLMLGFAFAAYAVARWRPVRWRAVALAGALLVAAALPLGLLISSGRSDLNVRNNYYVRVFPYQERVAWFADHGMPEASSITTLATEQHPAPNQVPVVAPDMNDPAFATLYAWIRNHGASTYFEWLGTHPRYVVTAPFDRPAETFNNDDAELGFYAAADATSTKPLDAVFAGPWWYAAGVAALALVVAALAGVLRQRPWQIAVLLAGVGAASVFAAWHGDGQEVTRHTVEGDVQLRVGIVIALLIAVPAWWQRFSPRMSKGDG